jgi:hypothetical protein
MSARSRLAFNEPLANLTVPCQSPRKLTKRPTGTIKDQKCTCEPTRPSGGPFGNPKAGANAQRSKRRSRLAMPPVKCPKCGATRLWSYHRVKSYIVYDLKFTPEGDQAVGRAIPPLHSFFDIATFAQRDVAYVRRRAPTGCRRTTSLWITAVSSTS